MKKINYVITIIILSITTHAFGIKPVTIIDTSLVIHKKENSKYFCGLSEGDQLVFSAEETTGKDIDEIDISEYLTTNTFYKENFKSKIINKTFTITKTGIYQFDFFNKTSSDPYNCKFKIQRIPASKETKKFNTSIFYRVKCDTAFVYNTEKQLISSDTVILPVVAGKEITIISKSTNNSNRIYIPVKIPANTISWSYYIGVGDNAENMFKQNEEKAQERKEELKSVSLDSVG